MARPMTDLVWMKSESTRGARLVLLALAMDAEPDGFIRIAHTELMDLTRLSSRSITKALNRLVELGEIRRSYRKADEQYNSYVILLK